MGFISSNLLKLFISIGILLGFGQGKAWSSDDSLIKRIPLEERLILDDLFQLLFSNGDFAYTFLGIKPMCMISYTMQYIRKFPENDRFCRETRQAKKGLDVWKKYQHLFSMGNLKLLIQESYKCEGHFSFILLNLNQCKSVIEKHLSVFQNHFGEKLSTNQILDLLSQGLYFQGEKIDHATLGILLGYPEKDVFAFIDQHTNRRNAGEKSALKPCLLVKNKNPLSPIKPSFFMSKRSQDELDMIKLEYSSGLRELIQIYYSEDFLQKMRMSRS